MKYGWKKRRALKKWRAKYKKKEKRGKQRRQYCLRKRVKISFATPTFMVFWATQTHDTRTSRNQTPLPTSRLPFYLSHIFKFHRFCVHDPTPADVTSVADVKDSELFYTQTWLCVWGGGVKGLAYWHKILQMGVRVGGPRNLPESLRRFHAIFGASE